MLSRLGAIITFVFWGYGWAVVHGFTKVNPQVEPSFATRTTYIKVFCDSDYNVYLPVSVAMTGSVGHIYFFIDDIIGMTWCQRHPSYGLPWRICEIRNGDVPITYMIFEPEISRRGLPEILKWDFHSKIEGLPCNSSVSDFNVRSKLFIPYVPRVLGHFSRGEESPSNEEHPQEGNDRNPYSSYEHTERPRSHILLCFQIIFGFFSAAIGGYGLYYTTKPVLRTSQ